MQEKQSGKGKKKHSSDTSKLYVNMRSHSTSSVLIRGIQTTNCLEKIIKMSKHSSHKQGCGTTFLPIYN